FVIMKIYETKNERFSRLVHIDAYRLERPEEMEALDFERFAADPRNLIMVEWPENISLKTKIAISFQADGDGEFMIEQRSSDHI
ncbi:MAG: tRNA (adenosine(37)-N6)-threonylcarbamoyltransferase complex ATPase subunit type 1 TsaE, partial [Patescibacteria group bacterium]|nr:tRNA (adenosine(37)-N6)-threonylcarbamoyltransferase complex ATPase subunit type 1 TsaE [Patescibacteria group bacterium]